MRRLDNAGAREYNKNGKKRRMNMKFGILTSGGDCAGLNAVIRAIGLYLLNNVKNAQIVGIPEGYAGLIRGESYPLNREDFEGLLTMGGTILRTRRTPFKRMTVLEEGGTRLSRMVANYKKMGLDCLFTLGGAGTHKTAALLSMEGCNVIGVPKTIDNDIYGTDVTFGFRTAVEVVTDAFDRIETTTRSHSRTMLVEVMGNKAGWLTLHSGIAAGAHMILIPEIPFNLDAVCDFVNARIAAGETYTMIAVAEGAVLDGEARFKKEERVFVRTELGESTVTRHLAEVVGERTGQETRYSVLGYLQRGGTPCAYDRLLCTRLGGYAAKLAVEGRFGVTAAVNGNNITFNALPDIAGKYKFVDPHGEEVALARGIGISFGDRT